MIDVGRSSPQRLPLRLLKKRELAAELFVAEDGDAAGQINLLAEVHPRFAAAKGRGHWQFDSRRQTKNPHRQGVNLLCFSPIEALRQDFIAPDVLAAQFCHRGGRVEQAPVGQTTKIFQAQGFGVGETGGDFIESSLSRGNDRLALLMEQGGKEQELRLLDLKATAAFAQAAFAQEQNLSAAPQGIYNHGPFLESHSHGTSIDAFARTGQVRDISPMKSDIHRRLQEARNALLALHKALVDSERETYEKTMGTIQSPNHFLRLLTNDPWFAWLQPMSQLIVAMDEALDEKEPLTPTAVESLLRQMKELLTASEEGEGFANHYYDALQRDPSVVMAHAAAGKAVGRRRASSA